MAEVRKGMEPLVDQAARDAASGDLARSFCVEAGAGTGKTTLLVDRFLSIVRSGKARCGQIVAITFTEKAAGEMKVRLRGKIEDLLTTGGLAPDERHRFETSRSELERAPISTIHSFAASMLREYPVEAGVDPGFTQLDAVEGSLFIEECRNDYLSGIQKPYDAVLKRFLSHGGSIEQIHEMLRQLYERRSDRRTGLITRTEGATGAAPVTRGTAGHGEETCGAGPLSASPAELHGLRDTIVHGAQQLSSLADHHCMNDEDRGCAAIRGLQDDVAVLGRLDGEELEDALLTVELPGPRGNKANWNPPETCTEQKEISARLRGVQGEYRKCFADRLRGALAGWLEGFAAFVERRKAEEGVLDFDDLLIRARELLDDTAALGSLRRRYRYILVDEFQDTDPLQAQIILLLAGSAGVPETRTRETDSRAPETEIRTPETELRAPESGRLFIVGDPKQSIYRFRKADVEIYERVREQLAACGCFVKITQNFRSVPGITEWVNGVFSNVIKKPQEGRFQPAYEPIHPRRTGSGAAVALLDLELDDEKMRADDVRRIEGEAIARLISALIDQRRSVMDTRKKEMRPLRYGDIAVIYPGTTGIDFYEDPLRAESIPYVVEGGKLYYLRQEVRDIASALWAIEDPWDSLSLVAALRSPLFGFSDEELFLHVRAGGRLNYLDPRFPSDGECGDVRAAFALLADCHRCRDERGPAGTLAELLQRTKYRELSLLRPHGDQRVLNINKALQQARSFGTALHSFRRFARWFRDQDVIVSAEGESPLVEEDEAAVRLLTIHRAKGLQFPVVILANLVQRRRRHPNILFGGENRFGFKFGPWMETGDFAALEEDDQNRDEAEMARLLYVAATRAGDLLVIPAVPARGNYYEILADYLPAAGSGGHLSDGAPGDSGGGEISAGDRVARWRASDLPVRRGVTVPFVRMPAVAADEKRRASVRRTEWLQRHAEMLRSGASSPVVITPSAIESRQPRLVAAAETAAPGERAGGGRAGLTGGGGGVVGAARQPEYIFSAGAGAEIGSGVPAFRHEEDSLRFGSAFHRLMEVVDLRSVDDLRELARSIAEGHDVAPDSGELERLALRALSSDLIGRAARASRVYREVPFTLHVNLQNGTCSPATGEEMHYIEGRIDLLFELDGLWTVVDYKTDNVSGDGIGERFRLYHGQGAVYAFALQELSIVPRGGIVFYFVRPDEARTLQVTAELTDAAKRYLSSFIPDRRGT